MAVASALVLSTVEAAVYAVIALIGIVYFKVVHGTLYFSVGIETLGAAAGVALLSLWVVALSLWTAPLAARARDVRFILGFVLGLWNFCTPVIYPISAIPEKWRPIAYNNPITAPIELIKWGLLETAPPTHRSIMISLAALAVVLGAGTVWFSVHEANAAREIA
jgi:lipopolysaccharide transport system permease protein